MIRNKVVYGGLALKIPAHLCLGQHIIDYLRKNCEGDNEDIAMQISGDNHEATTYKQILRDVVTTALGLQCLGVKRGDVVALCGGNDVEFITSAMAAVCCGAIITTINPMYSEDEIHHVVNISKPQYLLCSEAGLKMHLKTFKSIPSLLKIIQLNGPAVAPGVLELNRMKVAGDVDAFTPTAGSSGHDTVYVLYSSGTTGLPKGVMLSHINVLYSISLFESEPIEEYRLTQTIAPWYHAYGLMVSTNDILVKKKFVYFSNGFNPPKYLEAIQRYKVQNLLTVPPIVVFLGKSSMVDQYDLSSVELVLCGAAPLTTDTIDAALKKLPNCKGVLQGFGMTETSLTATRDYEHVSTRKPGSCGYPIPGSKAKVVDIETREKLGPLQEGELCVAGPNIVKGYMGNEVASREMFDDEGYLKTGDIGYYDEDGCFFVVDRLKELIKYKAFQVAPAAVESIVLQHSGVAECGVVGLPDEKAGELPVAFVMPKPGVTLTPQDILDFTKDKLSASSQLRGGVIIVDEIPKNPSGKILRRTLRQLLKSDKKSKL